MDDWHRKLVKELVQPPPGAGAPALDAATSLEIGFGQARSAIAYALELARAHRIPAAGSVVGDSIWLQLGTGRIRFTLNRRAGAVAVLRPGADEATVGSEADLGALARDSIDALVSAWRALPPEPTVVAPAEYFEDEPTKG